MELTASKTENIFAFVNYKKRFLIRLLMTLSLLAWCFGFTLPSLFPDSAFIQLILPFIKHAYSNVCHQVNSKCLYLNGNELLVCARCTGIYLGALLTIIFVLIYNKKILMNFKSLLLAGSPMVVDVLLNTIDIKSYSKTISFLTGVMFGAAVLLFILTIIENYLISEEVINEI